ncbi:MAG: hypothetical protein WCL51_14240 [Bacteroidota bacterium]
MIHKDYISNSMQNRFSDNQTYRNILHFGGDSKGFYTITTKTKDEARGSYTIIMQNG